MITIIRNRIMVAIRLAEEPPTKLDVSKALDDVDPNLIYAEIEEMLNEGVLKPVHKKGYTTPRLAIKGAKK